MLDKHQQFNKEGGADILDDMVPFNQMKTIMAEFSKITGLIFMQYTQYVKGDVMKSNDAKALLKFINYIRQKLNTQGDGLLRQSGVSQVKY
jgi:hypothetical protein